jgi:hypothetical protein
MLAADTLISVSPSLLIGTAVSLACFALLAWLVFCAIPRHLTNAARARAGRR